MLKRFLAKLRPTRELTPADLEARADAKQMRDDMETLRTGGLDGPPLFTHGGKASKGH